MFNNDLIWYLNFLPVTEIISSRPWTVKSKVNFTSPKRKSISTTTTSTITTAQLQFPRKKTPWRTILQPTGSLDTIVDNLDLEWHGYGEATMIRGLQEEMSVKEDAIPPPVFEDIFVFDQ